MTITHHTHARTQPHSHSHKPSVPHTTYAHMHTRVGYDAAGDGDAAHHERNQTTYAHMQTCTQEWGMTQLVTGTPRTYPIQKVLHRPRKVRCGAKGRQRHATEHRVPVPQLVVSATGTDGRGQKRLNPTPTTSHAPTFAIGADQHVHARRNEVRELQHALGASKGLIGIIGDVLPDDGGVVIAARG